MEHYKTQHVFSFWEITRKFTRKRTCTNLKKLLNEWHHRKFSSKKKSTFFFRNDQSGAKIVFYWSTIKRLSRKTYHNKDHEIKCQPPLWFKTIDLGSKLCVDTYRTFITLYVCLYHTTCVEFVNSILNFCSSLLFITYYHVHVDCSGWILPAYR